ncbi:MAG TPA: helix-turn-helix transcriptional regulator [Thermoanaerobaculia bacterium]|nr:helix-turn-helix transcriptional regulator [Thermoanaerobaculia bacterium]
MPRRLTFDPTATRFGAIVRRLRETKGWTLVQFGRKADMHPSYLSALERGENMPSLACVLRLAKVFDVEAWTIVAEVEGVS